MLALLHSSEMAKSPLPNHRLLPPLIANFLYSSFNGSITLSSSENRKDLHRVSASYRSYLGNIMGEYPPNVLFLQDSATKTIGPLIPLSYKLWVMNLFLEAWNFRVSSHWKGRIDLIFSILDRLKIQRGFSIWMRMSQLSRIFSVARLSFATSKSCFSFSLIFFLTASLISMLVVSCKSGRREQQSLPSVYLRQKSRKFFVQNFLSICSTSLDSSFLNISLRISRYFSQQSWMQSSICCRYLTSLVACASMLLNFWQSIKLWPRCCSKQFADSQILRSFLHESLQQTLINLDLCSPQLSPELPPSQDQIFFIINYTIDLNHLCSSIFKG